MTHRIAMSLHDGLESSRLADGADGSFGIAFDNSYARLPEHFYARVLPVPVRQPQLIQLNTALAEQLGLDAVALASPQGVAMLAGNVMPEGAEPLALAYAGHQFGHFVPQLGDGRANLLGEVVGRDGLRYDLQLKGSGPTPFSRRGDGRAALGPVLREYLLSEAMAALGVPTTRALAAVTTGEAVLREGALPGAVLTRVALGHVRVGTFEYFAAKQNVDALGRLARYVIARNYPAISGAEQAKPYRGLLAGVVHRQAELVAQWMLLGFVHGVMNTDNMSVAGETIDYGPCAFLEAYDPATVFSSIDAQGRYAYRNQPLAALWNLTRLAESLLPLLAEEEGGDEAAVAAATEVLDGFDSQFQAAYQAGLRQKLGLLTERAGDAALAQDLLQRMAANHADFTRTFRDLCEDGGGASTARRNFDEPAVYDAWAKDWHARLAQEPTTREARAFAMRAANPVYIPRNHLVETALMAATERRNFAPFYELLKVVSRPYEEQQDRALYAVPATAAESVRHTFCGT